jgi:hypothetical protein
VKRLRGVLLRSAYSKAAATAIGALLLAPAVALWAMDARWESWITDGAALVLGATGLAFVLAGLTGRKPDWTE